MKRKTLLTLLLCGIVSSSAIGDDKTKKKEKPTKTYSAEQILEEPKIDDYISADYVKEKHTIHKLDNAINALAYDDKYDHPFRELPNSDNIPFFDNFINRFNLILEDEYFYYKPMQHELDNPWYLDRVEREIEMSGNKIYLPKVILKSLGEVIKGYSTVQRISSDFKKATTIRKTIGKTKWTIGARFDKENKLMPHLQIKNAKVPGFLIPDWFNENILPLKKLSIDEVRVSSDSEIHKIEFDQKLSNNCYLSLEFKAKTNREEEYTAFLSIKARM